jgi:hypothetical protein
VEAQGEEGPDVGAQAGRERPKVPADLVVGLVAPVEVLVDHETPLSTLEESGALLDGDVLRRSASVGFDTCRHEAVVGVQQQESTRLDGGESPPKPPSP